MMTPRLISDENPNRDASMETVSRAAPESAGPAWRSAGVLTNSRDIHFAVVFLQQI
jgi:hypothetical protein